MEYVEQIDGIIKAIKKYEPEADGRIIRNAFSYEAKKIKESKEIKSPFKERNLSHNIEIAKTLVNLKLRQDIVVAGILHDALSLGASSEELKRLFGQTVGLLLEKRHKFKLISTAIADKRIEQKKRLIFTLISDMRQVFIELAHELDRLRKIKDLPEKEQKEIIESVSSIYIPLAHKLGIQYIRADMEDLVFKYSKPEIYKELIKKIRLKKKRREKEIEGVKRALNTKLVKAGLNVTIHGRAKHIYGIYDKMQRKNKSFDEIYDLSAVRVITNSISECYEVLGIVHSMWKPIAEEFDDYIAKPKSNVYQSLHTTVIGDNNKPIEIQIRTREMHDSAELGAAAHWKYKGQKPDYYDKKLVWMKEVLDWQKEISNGEGPIKIDFFKDEIYALTPKGEVVELPRGATVLDFAFVVHTEVGYKCNKAKVNGKVVPLDYELDNADTVEIILSPTYKTKPKWLGMVKTERAKNKIRQKLCIGVKGTSKEDIRKSHVLKISKTNNRIRLAKCCSPVPGDNVVGYLTTKRKISVHRVDCKEGEKLLSKAKRVEVDWGAKPKEEFSVKIDIRAIDKAGLLKDVLNVFSKSNIRILSTNAKTDPNKITKCYFEIQARDLRQLQTIIENIQKIDGVIKVSRT